MIWLNRIMRHINTLDPDRKFSWGIEVCDGDLNVVCLSKVSFDDGGEKVIRISRPFYQSSLARQNKDFIMKIMEDMA